MEATFTYSVQWRETDTPYEKRMDKYRRYQFLPQHLEASLQTLHGCKPSLLIQALVRTQSAHGQVQAVSIRALTFGGKPLDFTPWLAFF